jgi:Peptidase family M28
MGIGLVGTVCPISISSGNKRKQNPNQVKLSVFLRSGKYVCRNQYIPEPNMNTRFFLIICFLLVGFALPSTAQKRKPAPVAVLPKLPEFLLTQTEVATHLRFLASDELQGRRTGETGNRVAARYIAEQFRALGLQTPPNQADYLQPVLLQAVKPASFGIMRVGTDSLLVGNQFVVMAGGKTNQISETVYVGYGLTDDEYKNQDVRGKIVVTQVGSAEAKSPRQLLEAMQTKRNLATSKGAVGVVELVTGASLPWGSIRQYFGRETLSLAPATSATTTTPQTPLLHLWADNSKNQLASLKESGKTLSINTSGQIITTVASANVAGMIEGTDPILKKEYVLLTAHFDHVGMGKNGGPNITETDSIFNGARDNAMGTVALLSAAKSLMAQRPKRSVMVVAFTGEEVGLLGSRYYAEHPLVPLKQTIFNLNNDGAGYTDTTLVAVIGLERTGAKAEIEAGIKAAGLTVFAEPAPEQGLFDRSDNVSLAAKGVPAPTFSPGFKAFDEVLFKNYHQVSDQAETVDTAYLLRFCQAFGHTARLIANRVGRPQWSVGDKYEAVGKALYK